MKLKKLFIREEGWSLRLELWSVGVLCCINNAFDAVVAAVVVAAAVLH